MSASLLHSQTAHWLVVASQSNNIDQDHDEIQYMICVSCHLQGGLVGLVDYPDDDDEEEEEEEDGESKEDPLPPSKKSKLSS